MGCEGRFLEVEDTPIVEPPPHLRAVAALICTFFLSFLKKFCHVLNFSALGAKEPPRFYNRLLHGF